MTSQELRVMGLATLPIRFVLGWIYWGGGSRRFIYAPTKLDPYAHQWLANKFQSAMPGAIFGMSHVISFMLHHFYLLYASIIIFSFAELISGVALITGCFTRLAAAITIFISITLMLAFGWQGATCMDEWTMAVATLAMGFTMLLAGASAYSIDDVIAKRHPALAKRRWYILIASGPIKISLFKKLAQLFFIFTAAFTLITYNYYRGAIFSPYHPGPVSASAHHITLSNGILKSDGTVTFTLYVDGGTPAIASNIIRVELLNLHSKPITGWNGQALSQVPVEQIKNEYAYNHVAAGPYGLIAPTSAKATVTLKPIQPLRLEGNGFKLVVYTINGGRYEMLLNVSP